MLDRKTPPTYHPVTNIKLQLAEQRHLRKGVPLHIINAGKQEVIRIEIIFRGGTVHEEKNGQAFFATKMLSEGSSRYSAKEIATIMDSHGAYLELAPGFDTSTITIYTLSKHLSVLLPVVQSIVTEPVFPEKELEILKDIKKQKLRVDNSKNATVASKQFRNKLFPEHPYGNFLKEEDIDGISSADLLHFFRQNFHLNYEIIISGAVSSEVENAITGAFNEVPVRENPEVNISLPPETVPGQAIVRKEGSLQSSIRMGRMLFNLQHEDYTSFSVLNTIFGGYFGSRLMKSIREEKGYTYGIYSNTVPMRRAGYFVIGTDVIGEYTHQTIDEILLQIKNLRDIPVDPVELETVKNYMLGSFLSSLNTPFAIADQYKTIYFNDLPLDYYDRYINEINEVSADKLQYLAQKYLVPEELFSVIVGDL